MLGNLKSLIDLIFCCRRTEVVRLLRLVYLSPQKLEVMGNCKFYFRVGFIKRSSKLHSEIHLTIHLLYSCGFDFETYKSYQYIIFTGQVGCVFISGVVYILRNESTVKQWNILMELKKNCMGMGESLTTYILVVLCCYSCSHAVFLLCDCFHQQLG